VGRWGLYYFGRSRGLKTKKRQQGCRTPNAVISRSRIRQSEGIVQKK
jgi:hypothetical protein